MIDRKKLFGKTKTEWQLILCKQAIAQNQKGLIEIRSRSDPMSVKEKRRLRYEQKQEYLIKKEGFIKPKRNPKPY